MKTYLIKREKRNEEKQSPGFIKGVDASISMNLQASSQEALRTLEKEEKTRKATARQMWKPEKKSKRRTTFIKSLT
jgi:hypothetical protein